MKVLQRREYKPPTAKVKCYKCKSELEVEPSDIKSDRDSSYIECPVCKAFNAPPQQLYAKQFCENLGQ